MATYITTDSGGNVTYEIEPGEKKKMLPNANSDASEAAQAAQEAARAAQEAAAGVAESAAQIATNTNDITDLKDALTTKANIDGSYEGMTVGNAEQLNSTQYVEDKVPYLFRTTGGAADVGNREYVDKIVGGTVAWNQLIDNNASLWGTTPGPNATVSYDTTTRTCTLNGITNQGRATVIFPTTPGHVYFLSATLNSTVGGEVRVELSRGWVGFAETISANTNTLVSGILKPPSKSDSYERIQIFCNTSDYTMTIKDLIAVDLTQMFGSTIADYSYSLETATGVAWFKKLFPKDYYPYDAGTLKSVEGLVSHDMVGFNQWDEEWELGSINITSGANITASDQIRAKNYIPVIPAQTYHVNASPNVWMLFYDEGKSIITDGLPSGVQSVGNARQYGANTVDCVMPSNCAFVRFYCQVSYGATYKNDICINLSWSVTRNGEYEPYTKYSYPLDSTLTLRGIPKLDASGNLYYDGDEYLPDGTVNRRYGVVDLGTLNWVKDSNRSGVFYTQGLTSTIRQSSPWADMICDGYVLNKVSPDPLTDKGISSTNDYGAEKIFLKDSAFADYTSAQVATALNGKMLVYELAAPTTETAEPYQQVQICDDCGTEEYVIDSEIAVPIPIGHDTSYPANLRDKLQHLPDLADADGYYAIKQVGTQMSLELFRIPKAPTADGTYTLKATVSGGTPTYTWEVVE